MKTLKSLGCCSKYWHTKTYEDIVKNIRNTGTKVKANLLHLSPKRQYFALLDLSLFKFQLEELHLNVDESDFAYLYHLLITNRNRYLHTSELTNITVNVVDFDTDGYFYVFGDDFKDDTEDDDHLLHICSKAYTHPITLALEEFCHEENPISGAH